LRGPTSKGGEGKGREGKGRRGLSGNVAEEAFCLKSARVHTAVFVVTLNQQKAQLMLTNPRDAFRGQSRSPNMGPFDMLGMLSY